ncbi:MAG: 2'-5' RNA ligase family protein [Clostridia bacterium]|nr:2'-5' RNA ligase family protein [Clostridia bacterium]MBR4539520.1 2'-5' RNA ligase family protein [Clostridia bacterium]
MGVFPKAHVLWAGVKPSEALDSAARQVRQALSAAGIPFDQQDFNPHITLARKPAVPEHVMLSEIKIPQATMIVRDLCLYRSDHGENGMEYTVIGRSRKSDDGPH